eukprot:UN03379
MYKHYYYHIVYNVYYRMVMIIMMVIQMIRLYHLLQNNSQQKDCIDAAQVILPPSISNVLTQQIAARFASITSINNIK